MGSRPGEPCYLAFRSFRERNVVAFPTRGELNLEPLKMHEVLECWFEKKRKGQKGKSEKKGRGFESLDRLDLSHGKWEKSSRATL